MTCIAGAALGPSVTCIAEVAAPAAAAASTTTVVPLLLLLMAAVYISDMKGESNEVSSSSLPPQKFP